MASNTSLYFNFLKGRDTASPHMNKMAANAQRMAASMRQSSRLVVLAVFAIVAALAGGIAQLVAFTDAIWPMVGALAAVPAMAYAAAFGIATLIMGFKGLGAAMKRSTGGGADLAAQERRVALAQRAAAAAQDDLNQARRTAADLIADTVRSLARARLDEEGAVLAVADAQRELREARGSGDPSAIRRANHGYREAVQSLAEVRDRLADVTEEEAKRSAAGVEGSAEVQSALERQRDAEYELAQARKGGGGANAAAAAYAKLTAEGKALVDALRSQGAAWGKVRAAVQSNMLAGVAGDIKALSTDYLPVMRTHLVGIAVGWNNAFRGTAQTMAAAGFVKDMNTSLGNVATMWQRVGLAFAPFWSGFRHLVVVGSEFMPRLGSWVLRLANRFDAWAKKARDTGKAHDWIEKALQVGRDFNQLLFALGGATGALFAAGAADEGMLDRLTAGAAAMRDFWRTPEGHAEVAGLFSQLRDIWSEAWKAFKTLLDLLAGLDLSGVVGVFTIFNEVLKFFAANTGVLNVILPVLIPLITAYELAAFGASVKTRLWATAIEFKTYWMKTSNGETKLAKFAILAYRFVVWNATKALFMLRNSLIAQKVAMVATAAWTKIVTVAQWLWNAAMMANPIGLIIIAIIAVIAVIVILWMKSAGFRNFFIGLWEHIWSFLKGVGHWFANDFANFFVRAWDWIKNAFHTAVQWVNDKIMWVITTILGIRQRIIDGARGLWDGLVLSFKAAVNHLIRLWNNFRLTLGGGTVMGLSIPSVTLDTPDIPYLAAGGIVPATPGGMLARLGEGGQPEVVAPLSSLRGGGLNVGGPGGVVTVRIELSGPEEVKRLIRRIVSDNGGSVQTTFGRG